MDQPLLVDRLKNVQVLQCGNMFCSGLGEKQPRGGFIFFFFLTVYLKVHVRKGTKPGFFSITERRRVVRPGVGEGAVRVASELMTVWMSHSTMSSVSSGSFISLKGQGPEGGHAQVVRAGDSKARTTTEHLFPINPAPGSAQYNTWALMWTTLYYCFW